MILCQAQINFSLPRLGVKIAQYVHFILHTKMILKILITLKALFADTQAKNMQAFSNNKWHKLLKWWKKCTAKQKKSTALTAIFEMARNNLPKFFSTILLKSRLIHSHQNFNRSDGYQSIQPFTDSTTSSTTKYISWYSV